MSEHEGVAETDSVCMRAYWLVNGDRNVLYGDFREDYEASAAIASAGLRMEDENMTALEGEYHMLSVKMSRLGRVIRLVSDGVVEPEEAKKMANDTLTDICGYAEGVWKTLCSYADDDDDDDDGGEEEPEPAPDPSQGIEA